MKDFIPTKIYYEKEVENYDLGKYLFEKYADTPKILIESHNNIPEMRAKENKEFPQMKKNLIIGVRKSLTYVPNNKTSDFLVPFTSSGCTAMCLYCYLVCNYNKCAYLRLFVNREKMLDKMIKTVNSSEKDLVFEIGSNSDLILENTITKNLEWLIPQFAKTKKGLLTFPTKFDMVDGLLNLDHRGKTIIRMSVNPDYIIRKVEFGTSSLHERVVAINKLAESEYRIGILIAPIILVDNWENLYLELIEYLAENLSLKAKKSISFEVIFMTYSFIHNAINTQAFPNSINLYDKSTMMVRGKGKYCYKTDLRENAKDFIRTALKSYFPENKIEYLV